jgi:Tfp pilus assembly protein PilO
VVIFILVLVIGTVFLWPKYKKLGEVQSNIEQKELELQGSENYFLSLSKSEEKLTEYPDELSMIDSALPEDPSLPSMSHFLQQTASAFGLVLTGMSPFTTSPITDNPNIKENSFTVDVTGAYKSFKNFVNALETSSRIIEVDGISFSEPSEEGFFDFKMKLKTFSR